MRLDSLPGGPAVSHDKLCTVEGDSPPGVVHRCFSGLGYVGVGVKSG